MRNALDPLDLCPRPCPSPYAHDPYPVREPEDDDVPDDDDDDEDDEEEDDDA